MLTADLVRARRRGEELVLIRLDAKSRVQAQAIAHELIETARGHVGQTREELEEAIDAIDVEPRFVRLKAGLAKLVDDQCTFEADLGLEPSELRRDLFLRASAARRALSADARFDRDALLTTFAGETGLLPEQIERGLYADLRGAHVLREAPKAAAGSLVASWERGQAQAVLLRAVRVVVDVRCASAGATRAFFHRLKFLCLLHTIAKTSEGHRIVIDGPMSLFESVTKYGQKLALVLPVLEGCEAWSLVADLRWGKARTPLVFRLEGGATPGELPTPSLPDHVAALATAFERLKTGWRVMPATTILDLPGVGLCVPDLVFSKGVHTVHFEAMGYWSRDAVWRRVELVQRGLATPILFAVSTRLRVSAEVLDDTAPSALYVYKGSMSARAVAERLEHLATR